MKKDNWIINFIVILVVFGGFFTIILLVPPDTTFKDFCINKSYDDISEGKYMDGDNIKIECIKEYKKFEVEEKKIFEACYVRSCLSYDKWGDCEDSSFYLKDGRC